MCDESIEREREVSFISAVAVVVAILAKAVETVRARDACKKKRAREREVSFISAVIVAILAMLHTCL